MGGGGGGRGGGKRAGCRNGHPPTHIHTHTPVAFFFSFAKPFPAFTVQFIYKRYIYYHLTLHLGTFVICFLLFHTDADEKCGMWVNFGRGDVRVGF